MKIEIEHVSKKIKDALVLDDVCMTLESGNRTYVSYKR